MINFYRQNSFLNHYLTMNLHFKINSNLITFMHNFQLDLDIIKNKNAIDIIFLPNDSNLVRIYIL